MTSRHSSNGNFVNGGNLTVSGTLGAELNCGANSIGFTLQAITQSTGTMTIDWRKGNHATITLTASITTCTWTAPSNPCHLSLKVIQGGSGSYTVAWPALAIFVGKVAPILTTAVGGKDHVGIDWDGTNYWLVGSLNFGVPA
jgi:hypothetical protein